MGTGVNFTITVPAPPDTTPPETQITSGPTGWVNTQAVTFVWTGSDNLTPTEDLVYSWKLEGPTSYDWSLYSSATSVTLTGLSEGYYTFYVRAKDQAGNVDPTPASQSFGVDITPPTLTKELSGTEGDNGWWRSDVTVTLTAEDEVSGVASIEYSFDGANWVSYTGPFTITAEGTTTLYHRATDNAGNVYELPSQEIKIDKTPPTLTIATPTNGATYILNQEVLADWTATDDVSGIASAYGSAPSGSPIDTSRVGTHTFYVYAKDEAGNSAEMTVSYTVIYSHVAFLPPLKGGYTYKAGSTIPVKFRLTDYYGNYVSTAVARIYVDGLDNPGTPSGSSNIGNLFRYDPENNQYVFDLSTKGMSLGRHTIYVVLDDGTIHSVTITLK